jgi:hypothetical protein
MKKRGTPTVVTTIVLTLITVFFWVGFEVYRSLTIKPTSKVSEEIVTPLEPKIDQTTLDGLGQRLYFQDSDIGNNQTNIATIAPTPTVIAIPSATASSTPLPSGSGQASTAPSPTNSPAPTATP